MYMLYIHITLNVNTKEIVTLQASHSQIRQTFPKLIFFANSKQNFLATSLFRGGQNEYKKSHATIKTEQKVKFLCGFST